MADPHFTSSELANWTDEDIIELYEQLAATRQQCMDKRGAERAAIVDLRVWIGRRPLPKEIREKGRLWDGSRHG